MIATFEKPVYHQSHLKKFELCAYGYYLDVIEKRRGLGNFWTARGNGVDAARNLDLQQKITTGQDLPVDELCDAARDDVRRRVMEDELDAKDPQLEGLGKQAAAARIIDTTVPLVRLDRRQFLPAIQPAHVQQFFELNLPDYPFDVAGTLDTLTADAVLIDLKTTRARWNEQKVAAGYQPALYTLGVRTALGVEPRWFEYQILIATKTLRTQRIVVAVTEAMIVSVIRRFEVMHQAITAGVFPPADRGSWKCSPTWCRHYRHCKYVQA